MMQIVLKTLQTDSGDQPGSSCLSKKQKIKGDVWSWAQWSVSQLWAEASPGWRVPDGAGDLYELLCQCPKYIYSPATSPPAWPALPLHIAARSCLVSPSVFAIHSWGSPACLSDCCPWNPPCRRGSVGKNLRIMREDLGKPYPWGPDTARCRLSRPQPSWN